MTDNKVNFDSFKRDFDLNDDDFNILKELSLRWTGISLSDNKKTMIYARLSKRLRALNLSSFSQYCIYLKSNTDKEKTNFINAITTNLTSFFRENHHFSYLETHVIPKLINKNAHTRKIRIWSAGCSTGEEPYSIAMLLMSMPALKGWDIKILSTDLDSDVIQKAESNIYTRDRVQGIDPKFNRYIHDIDDETVSIDPSVKGIIRFRVLNLLDPWPFKNEFDIVFCRNVVIYFDKNIQKILFSRYAKNLSSNGYLFIGHSETLNKLSTDFTSVGRTIYFKRS